MWACTGRWLLRLRVLSGQLMPMVVSWPMVCGWRLILGWPLRLLGLGLPLRLRGLGWPLRLRRLRWLLRLRGLGRLLRLRGLGWLLRLQGLGWLLRPWELHLIHLWLSISCMVATGSAIGRRTGVAAMWLAMGSMLPGVWLAVAASVAAAGLLMRTTGWWRLLDVDAHMIPAGQQ